MNRLLVTLLLFIKDSFNISHVQEDNIKTIESIERGVDFKGINVWTLIFAIFIASIGLNVNSTAVIIGAMLISPLMGPIMGLGLSVGINDFSLLKKSLRNMSVAVVISIITSSIYFYISPLNEAQSELLSRTIPTIYDVLIALFGGFAGIVAGSSKEKGNVIPGVAIATALMPPLCTAGFGIATGNFYYFIGAAYLFFINAVMISLSTFLFVRFLKFPLKQEVDKAQTIKVKRYIYIIVTITILPSIYFAYQIVQETIFKTNAANFMNKEFIFNQSQVIDKMYSYSRNDSSKIEVLLAGEKINEAAIEKLRMKLPDYSLKKVQLNIKQGINNSSNVDMSQIKAGIIEEIYHKNNLALADKDRQINVLKEALVASKTISYPIKNIAEEMNAINPKVGSASVNRLVYYNIENKNMDTTITVNLRLKSRLNKEEHQTLEKWLVKRLNAEDLNVIIE